MKTVPACENCSHKTVYLPRDSAKSSPISSDLADVTVLDPVPEVLVLAVLADFELLSSATSSFLGSPSFDFFP